MIAGPLVPAAKPWVPHTSLVVYTIAAGLVMVGFGAFRLSLPTPRDSPYTARGIRTTYSLMIALGLVLAALAVRWRFFA